jgi:hypothetical protein
VNPVFMMSSKCWTSLSVTISPSSVGWSRRSTGWTYPRSWIVWMIGAYVLGRPIPNFSRAFTRLASL